MTTLERRCRRLLLAYPAAYRRARGEEMLGTLLEATAAGRAWPLPRDCRAIIMGGLRVRTAQNSRLSTPANLRLATTLGCLLYLSARSYQLTSAAMSPRQPQEYAQLLLAAGLLACTAMLVFRPRGRWRPIATLTAVAALIAGTAAGVSTWPAATNVAQILAPLLVLAAFALLSRGAQRLPALWLWPPGLIVVLNLLLAAAALVRPWQGSAFLLSLAASYLWLLMEVLAVVWIVIDARPAVGVAVYLGLVAVTFMASNLLVISAWSVAWKFLGVALVVAALSSWRLRRQATL